ncbi:hypothetical protein C7M84_013655 [Penaeus vannamei]|uniref:Uncharacterized protein n=1 Tax=Penaeus vannamei TaxID=6689 RepID=A0A423SVN4_PENVA|nr:hypothetical protein C7M84_013655 [Penaeus vannamei]
MSSFLTSYRAPCPPPPPPSHRFILSLHKNTLPPPSLPLLHHIRSIFSLRTEPPFLPSPSFTSFHLSPPHRDSRVQGRGRTKRRATDRPAHSVISLLSLLRFAFLPLLLHLLLPSPSSDFLPFPLSRPSQPYFRLFLSPPLCLSPSSPSLLFSLSPFSLSTLFRSFFLVDLLPVPFTSSYSLSCSTPSVSPPSSVYSPLPSLFSFPSLPLLPPPIFLSPLFHSPRPTPLPSFPSSLPFLPSPPSSLFSSHSSLSIPPFSPSHPSLLLSFIPLTLLPSSPPHPSFPSFIPPLPLLPLPPPSFPSFPLSPTAIEGFRTVHAAVDPKAGRVMHRLSQPRDRASGTSERPLVGRLVYGASSGLGRPLLTSARPSLCLSQSLGHSVARSLSPAVPQAFSHSLARSSRPLSSSVLQSLTPSVLKSLCSSSFSPSVTQSFSHSLPRSSSPSVTQSFSHFSHSLPRSLSPSLPQSLRPSVTQSFSHSLPHSPGPQVPLFLRP